MDVEVRKDALLNQDGIAPQHGMAHQGDETQNIVYRGSDSNLYRVSAGSTWTQVNLTQAAGAPPAAARPFGYVTDAAGVQHVVYPGADGMIYELFGGESWRFNVISAAAGAPKAAGDPMAFTTFDPASERLNVQHVLYRGEDGHIHELFAGDIWRHSAITALANAPRAAGDPVGYVTYNAASGRLDIQHVIYRGEDGGIHELFAGADWRHNAVTDLAGAPKARGNRHAYTTEFTNVQHIVYRGQDDHIHELFAGAAGDTTT